MKDLSAITKIMDLAERWRTAGGREEHHALKDQLFREIERLADERYDAGLVKQLQRGPLTPDEIYAAIRGVDSLDAVVVARAVERAHGITTNERK